MKQKIEETTLDEHEAAIKDVNNRLQRAVSTLTKGNDDWTQLLRDLRDDEKDEEMRDYGRRGRPLQVMLDANDSLAQFLLVSNEFEPGETESIT